MTINNTHIILVGEDGISRHASGLIDREIVEDYTAVERNGHTYVFEYKISGMDAYQYKECKTPYHITEF